MTAQGDDAPSTRALIRELLAAVKQTVNDHEPRSVDAFLRTKVAGTATLADIGQELGLTRERIRQLAVKVRDDLNVRHAELATEIAQRLSAELPPIGHVDVARRWFDDTFSAVDVETAYDNVVKAFALYLALTKLELSPLNSYLVTEDAAVSLADVAQLAVSEADDVGLVDLGTILARTAPGLLSHFDAVVDALGLARVGDRVALRNTQNARAKVAIMALGRPAHTDEIAEFVGLAPARVSGVLVRISSLTRAGRCVWGLNEWVDEEYETVAIAIRRRIDQRGGSVQLDALLAELPARFGVKESSVRSIAESAQFQVVDGMVRMADEDTITFRPLEEVATRNSDGEPCWEFVVRPTHLSNACIVRFPPALLHELGCGPNEKRDVRVTEPPGSADVYVAWRLASITPDGTIGRVRDILTQLGASDGRRCRLVIQSDQTIRFELLNTPPLE